MILARALDRQGGLPNGVGRGELSEEGVVAVRSKPVVGPGVWSRRLPSCVLAVVFLLCVAPAQARPFVYVANSFGGALSQYKAGMGGLLAPLSPASVPGGSNPGFVAVSPDGRSVYSTSITSGELFQF